MKTKKIVKKTNFNKIKWWDYMIQWLHKDGDTAYIHYWIKQLFISNKWFEEKYKLRKHYMDYLTRGERKYDNIKTYVELIKFIKMYEKHNLDCIGIVASIKKIINENIWTEIIE